MSKFTCGYRKCEAQAAPCRRLIFVWLYRLCPSVREAAVVFKPETLVRWHRSGFRLYWRCKSRRRVGRPAVPADIRDLIRTISRDNPLWGAPRIHGELLELGIDIAQSTVTKYMSRRRGPRSPGWQVFLRNHTAHIAGVDLFVVPTIGFKLLYGLVILSLERRRLLWTNVTANPTAEWVAQQISEAFPWDAAPRYLIRDRDTSYGAAVTRRLQAMGIRDRPITPHSPWQNGHVEWLIGSIRRECLDHVVVLGERHLRHLLANYATYYNRVRTHLALDKDAPLHRSPSALRSDRIIGRHRLVCTVRRWQRPNRQHRHRRCCRGTARCRRRHLSWVGVGWRNPHHAALGPDTHRGAASGNAGRLAGGCFRRHRSAAVGGARRGDVQDYDPERAGAVLFQSRAPAHLRVQS